MSLAQAGSRDSPFGSSIDLLQQEGTKAGARTLHPHLERRNSEACDVCHLLVRQFFPESKDDRLTLIGAKLSQGVNELCALFSLNTRVFSGACDGRGYCRIVQA
jgi:hypothetical protein